MSEGTVKASKKVKAIDTAPKAEVSRDGNDLSDLSMNLSPERIAQIIKRINENFYDREDVLEVVAERILRSPELQALIKSGRIE